ncbi:MAG TPA: NUDIX domain-containing protein [Mariniphaga anaerophila]|uniref:NUDIX domain-containing protein n=1 Tax=Mariniphaga anaerophila TaxID=1484053 RepID=A0A831PKX7_9BACT|nr:NUDIX domain-containing protein [Mariniphaga anaerophila]
MHPVVHMHVLKPDKSLLLQKRPETKLIQPGKWDTAVGGHISAGENPEEALQKEAYEEIGLTGFTARQLMVYKWESEVEAELVYLFLTHDYKNFNVHTDEMVEARFWSRNQIDKLLGKHVFTPNFEYEFALLKKEGLL